MSDKDIKDVTEEPVELTDDEIEEVTGGKVNTVYDARPGVKLD